MGIYDDMVLRSALAQVEHVSNGAVARMEFVMHPDAFEQLARDNVNQEMGFLCQRTDDGVFEFFNTPIRLDPKQDGWELRLLEILDDEGEPLGD